ncbi:predicted protein [Nematostella vectensis]|uniref:Rab-GAP TBC domain-containing protein n=2 Tax=Nematostella vectensis TaxID=45351 RepID=A7SA57_NEMVE|nr:predicted protein [Nematostella vectensis]|eukprot:XP_001631463.1 predicted protein [Nematostella vectensis]
MEFYEPQSVRAVAIRPLDPDRILNESLENIADGPSTDRYGFVGKHKQASETTLPVQVLREREIKWLEMLNNYEKWITKKYKKLRERCRKGIPPAVRGLAWRHLSGSIKMEKQNPNLFEDLASKPSPEWENTIEKDLCRVFPYHEQFTDTGGQGQKDLFRVLKAYSLYDSHTGYCQAMAPVVAVLLMHMTAEEAFWCLVMICSKYLPGYYGPKLEAIQLDGAIFGGLLSKTVPHISKHMKQHHIDPLMYMTEWYMCLLARNLPFATVLRVWDMFFCEGIKVLFRTTIAIMKIMLSPRELRKCQG